MIRFLLPLVISFVSFSAQAAKQKQIANCQVGALSFEVYSNPDSDLERWPDTVVEVGADGKKQTTIARLEADSAGAITRVQLPKFWEVESIPGSACRRSAGYWPLHLYDFLRLKFDAYFLSAEIDPETATEKLPELIKACEATPVTLDIICETGGSGPLGCQSIEILNRQIEVHPAPGCG